MINAKQNKGAGKMDEKKLQFIQDVVDKKGMIHSVLIYGPGDLRWGNLTFKTMKDVMSAINGN